MLSPKDCSLAQQIACVARELRLRERVYPRLVLSKRLTADQAFAEQVTMRAVLLTLESLRDGTIPHQPDLL